MFNCYGTQRQRSPLDCCTNTDLYQQKVSRGTAGLIPEMKYGCRSRDVLLDNRFRLQLDASAHCCCKCGVTTWLNFTSPSSPYGKLSCRSCAHVACTECSLPIPSAVQVPTDRMQIHNSATYGWICSAPGCGWSQIVDLEILQPKPVGFLSACIWSWTKSVWPDTNGVLLDFEQQTCRACSHACCMTCAKFQVIDPGEHVTTSFSTLVEASKNAYLGSITPQEDLVAASKQAYQNLVKARTESANSSTMTEASVGSIERPLTAVAIPDKALRAPFPSYSLFPQVTTSPSESKTSTYGSQSSSSRKGTTASSQPSESSEKSSHSSTENSLHVQWADQQEPCNLHRAKARRLPKKDPHGIHPIPTLPTLHPQHPKCLGPGSPQLWMTVVSLSPLAHDFPGPPVTNDRPLPLRDRYFSWDAKTEIERPSMAHVVRAYGQ